MWIPFTEPYLSQNGFNYDILQIRAGLKACAFIDWIISNGKMEAVEPHSDVDES